ncbi:hypothetical protein SFC65_04350 [Priestia filamentosa]|uniref:hypothetical protein n=1 Tax=Priestia filamentosa TaxID=1402861 RepID=UPI0039823E29
MNRVFLHLHSKGKADWENPYLEFERIPVEGEYVSLDGAWYQVELVVHTPSSEEMCAEVYAVKVDPEKVKKSKVKFREGGQFSSQNAWSKI